jgi:uncharacterized protein with HEPN domain
MSSRTWVFRVRDILQAAKKIEKYTKRMTLTQFAKNELVMDAVARNFEIIGEASANIPSSIQQKHPEIPWKDIISMRNILIHEYYRVELGIVWHTIKKSLPTFVKQLNTLLQSAEK